MPERTEDQKLSQEPLGVILGGKPYKVKLLNIKESREWRKQAADLLGANIRMSKSAIGIVPGQTTLTVEQIETIAAGQKSLLAVNPDSLLDLFFSYAKELNRDEIESTANEVELSEAFDQVLSVAFPLGKSLTRLSQAASGRQPAKPSNAS